MQIAEIEAMHRCRFQKLAELLKDHTFFERCETENGSVPTVVMFMRAAGSGSMPCLPGTTGDISCLMNWRAMFLGECDFSGSKKD